MTFDPVKVTRFVRQAIGMGVRDSATVARFASRELAPDSCSSWRMQTETPEQQKLMNEIMPVVVEELSRNTMSKVDAKTAALLKGAAESFPDEPAKVVAAVYLIRSNSGRPIEMKKICELVASYYVANGMLPQLLAVAN